jgi:hypothetical protein
MKQLTLIAAALAAAVASTSGESVAANTPLGTIRQAASDFNTGNYAAWAGACESSAMVTDDFAPYTWNGPGACHRWYVAWQNFTKAHGVNNMTVLFGAPIHMEIGTNTAYVVLPAALHFNQHGKPARMTGSVIAIVLHKDMSGDWKMTAWTWADGK